MKFLFLLLVLILVQKPNMDKYGTYGGNFSSDESSQYSYGGASTSSFGSCTSHLSTESTYGTLGTWTGKDTCGYEADTESLASTK